MADWTPFITKVKDTGATVTFNTHWNPADHAAFMKAWVADPPDSFVYLQYGASVPRVPRDRRGRRERRRLGNGPRHDERPRRPRLPEGATRRSGTRPPASRTRARATTRSTCSPTPGASPATRGTSTANIAELKRNIMRGVSGGYWFGARRGELHSLRIPSEMPGSVARESAPLLPDPARRQRDALAPDHRTRRRTSRRSTCKQPWLSF